MDGIAVEIGAEAVVVRSAVPLTVLSSAVVGGGWTQARAVINLHVRKNDPCADPARMLAAHARQAAVPEPYVGLLTSARTQHAVVAEESAFGLGALAVVTVGLENRLAAGRAEAATVWSPATINTVLVLDADPEAAAMVNAVITATEVKVLALQEGEMRGPDGEAVSGTSTDAVVIAATGRGPRARFGGPASELGWTLARATRLALGQAISEWKERNP